MVLFACPRVLAEAAPCCPIRPRSPQLAFAASVALAVVAACALAAVLASSSAHKAALLGEPFDSNLPVQRGNLKEFPDKERARETSAIKFLVLLVLCIRGNVVESSTEDPQGP